MSQSFHFAKRLEVQFRDCDPLGHVNNAVYISYFEQARFAYWRDALGFGDVLGALSFIIARVECNFRSQARMGDQLDVRIRLSAIGRSSFTFDYEIVQASGDVPSADGADRAAPDVLGAPAAHSPAASDGQPRGRQPAPETPARVVADGRSVQVMYDYAAQRSVPVPDELRARAEQVEGRTFAVHSPETPASVS